MEAPSLFLNMASTETLTGIFIPMSGDEVLNLYVALQNRASGERLPAGRAITEVAHSYTAFETALKDLDAKISLVLGGTTSRSVREASE